MATLKIKNSATVTTGIPSAPTSLEYGELAMNYAEAYERVYLKNSADNIITLNDWSHIINKPSTFTPSSHTHTVAGITDFPTNLWTSANSNLSTVDWTAKDITAARDITASRNLTTYGQISALGNIVVQTQGISKLTLIGGVYGANYNTVLGARSDAGGVLQLGNNGANYIVGGNTAVGGSLYFYVNASSDFITSTNGTLALTLASTGAATFASTISATTIIASDVVQAYNGSGGYSRLQSGAAGYAGYLEIYQPNGRIGYIGYALGYMSYAAEIGDHRFNANIQAPTAIFSNLTAGYLPYHTANGLVNSGIYTDGTNFGIGLTSINAKLEVAGNGVKVAISDNSAAETWNNTTLGQLIFRTHYNLYEHNKIYAWGNYSTGGYFSDLRFQTTGIDRMAITWDGNMGIGTTTPKAKLEIYSTTNPTIYLTDGVLGTTYGGAIRGYGVTGLGGRLQLGTLDNSIFYPAVTIREQGSYVGIGTDNPSANLHVHEKTNTDAYFRLSNPSNSIFLRQVFATDDFDIINNSNWNGIGASIRFFTNADSVTPKMVILRDGDVGIGTTAPNDKLDVSGIIRVSRIDDRNQFSTIQSDGAGVFRVLSVRPYAGSGNYGTYRFEAKDSTGSIITPLSIDTLGNVGIGTTAPTLKLEADTTTYGEQSSIGFHYSDDSQGSAINSKWYSHVNSSIRFNRGYNATGGLISFWTEPENGALTERLRITSAGFVGIGYTADPTSGNKLAVNGNTYIGGNIISIGEVTAYGEGINGGAGLVTSVLGSGSLTNDISTFNDAANSVTFNAYTTKFIYDKFDNYLLKNGATNLTLGNNSNIFFGYDLTLGSLAPGYTVFTIDGTNRVLNLQIDLTSTESITCKSVTVNEINNTGLSIEITGTGKGIFINSLTSGIGINAVTYNGTAAEFSSYLGDHLRLTHPDTEEVLIKVTNNGLLLSIIATGTAPFTVASTTPVANLSIGGNASTATTLATSRTIWGQSFNGSANISGALTGITTLTGSKGSAGTLLSLTDGVNSNFEVVTSSLLTTIGNGAGSGALALKSNNTELVRILSNGNVNFTQGISTGGNATNATLKFDVINHQITNGEATAGYVDINWVKAESSAMVSIQVGIYDNSNGDDFGFLSEGYASATPSTLGGYWCLKYGETLTVFPKSSADFVPGIWLKIFIVYI